MAINMRSRHVHTVGWFGLGPATIIRAGRLFQDRTNFWNVLFAERRHQSLLLRKAEEGSSNYVSAAFVDDRHRLPNRQMYGSDRLLGGARVNAVLTATRGCVGVGC